CNRYECDHAWGLKAQGSSLRDVRPVKRDGAPQTLVERELRTPVEIRANARDVRDEISGFDLLCQRRPGHRLEAPIAGRGDDGLRHVGDRRGDARLVVVNGVRLTFAEAEERLDDIIYIYVVTPLPAVPENRQGLTRKC